MRFSDEKIESARNFANKLWNAARFVLMNLDIDDTELPCRDKLAPEDKWILSKLNTLADRVNNNLDNYELGVALSEIYDFIWDVFCDWYIELAKTRLSNKEDEGSETAQRTIAYVLRQTLKLLHPYMPFITEEIYQSLPHDDESIMISEFPTYSEELDFSADAEAFEKIIAVIRAVRVRRSEMNVPPSKKAELYIVTEDKSVFGEYSHKFFCKLASATEVKVVDAYEGEEAVSVVTDAATAYIPLSEIVDMEKEKARLEAELKKNDGEIERIEKKLANEGFVAKAPAAVVEGERAKLEKYRATREGILAALSKINK